MGHKSRKRKRRKSQPKGGREGKYRATLPGGRVMYVDDIAGLPEGTMYSWNDPGDGAMRWCIRGGGWPFDD
ncbi:MAG: hypothetical protein EP330_13495 [Deltaproteobacteria bacterium]|nr:MAG: hypothetical protein EP330_13495 [Deltaproteobacteria bacterium]